MWVKRTGAGIGTSTGTGGLANAIPLIAKGRAEAETAAADINYFLGIDASTGNLVADFEEGQSGSTPSANHPITGTKAISADNTWHHVAATYDGSTWHLYLDGTDAGSLSVGKPANAATNVLTSIGSALTTPAPPPASSPAASTRSGSGTAPAPSPRSRPAKTARSPLRRAGSLGVWNLNEGSGSSLADNSGNSKTGAAVGSPTWVAGFVPPNRAPVASADSYTTAQDTTLVVPAPGVLGNDTDADGDSLTAVKVSDPAHGTVTLNASGGLTYVPTGGYSGPDSFTYKANDGTSTRTWSQSA